MPGALLAAVPLLAGSVLLYGALRGVNVYEAFVEGAANGLKTAYSILPYIAGAMLLISLLRSSGLLALLSSWLEAPLQLLGIPGETLPLLIIRPVSGSASLAALSEIYLQHGPDSLAGRAASAMMGSTETVLYTVAVYLGAAGIKKTRGILLAALLSGLIGAIAASHIVRLL